MLKPFFTLVISCAFLSGCVIPPLNTDTISETPVDRRTFAEAQQAVRACSALPNTKEMFDRFERLGYRPDVPDKPTVTNLAYGGQLLFVPYVFHDTGKILAQAGEDFCFVGVRGMTPEQSYRLAQILVSKFAAKTNAELGQGLSHHVVQAWQYREDGRPKALIAANKTWSYDKGYWPDEPGAAVTLLIQ